MGKDKGQRDRGKDPLPVPSQEEEGRLNLLAARLVVCRWCKGVLRARVDETHVHGEVCLACDGAGPAARGSSPQILR